MSAGIVTIWPDQSNRLNIKIIRSNDIGFRPLESHLSRWKGCCKQLMALPVGSGQRLPRPGGRCASFHNSKAG